MLIRVVFETAQSALSSAGIGLGDLPGQMVVVVLVAVLVLQWDIIQIVGSDGVRKARWLLLLYVVPLALVAALILGRRFVLVIFGT